MTIHDLLIAPFADYAFMRRALAACLMLSIGGTPLGVFMQQRRLTLAGDAMSHAILPGVACAYAFWGLAPWPMGAAAFLAGLLVAGLAYGLSRTTLLREDASLSLIYLLALAGGVVLISRSGSGVDLLHILFGNILGTGRDALLLAAGVACVSVICLCMNWRALVIECFDSDFLRATRRGSRFAGLLFFGLVVLNLVAAFQVLGTLMALGLMILPALTARFATRSVEGAVVFGIGAAALSSVAGLLLSFHLSMPSGPAVVLTAGGLCIAFALLGAQGSVRSFLSPNPKVI